VTVVTGAQTTDISKELSGMPVRVIHNENWRMGVGTSIAAGLRAFGIEAAEVDAAVVMVCDQIFADAGTIRALVEIHGQTGASIVASHYAGTLGVPALFARRWFPALLALAADEGAKRIIEAHRSEVSVLEFPGGALDVDTPGDFALLEHTRNGRASPIHVPLCR
jgi:molybdenum cofactor cytidylyltransferase